MKALAALVALVVLAGCGNAERRYIDNGICYEHERQWMLGLTFLSRTEAVKPEWCAEVQP